MPKKKFYVTTPIYYVNDRPHIGHAYTNIAADVLARYHRLKGESVFLLTGTDEHGQKVEQAAQARGKEVRAFVDELHVAFKDAARLMNVKYEKFIRTTDASHKKVVRDIILKCDKAGDIYKGEYEGNYCVPCESYWTELQLAEGLCPTCKRETKKVKEESYFFRLSKYEKKLLEWYEHDPAFLSPGHRSQEIIARVKDGLKDLSITRTAFSWGIPFPLDKKHVVYVWFDALTNYLSGIGYPSAVYKKFWPADVHMVGKEINWFHAVIWPAMLMSAKLPLPKKIYAHGWLTINGEKMSKSRGNVITPEYLAGEYGVDVSRYFLLRDIAFGADGDFSEESLVARNNADLADALGNLVQRSVVLIEKYGNGRIPTPGVFGKEERELVAASRIHAQFEKQMNALEFHKALETIWSFVAKCNKYITEHAPWKNEKKRKTVLYCLAESLRLMSAFISPFMPQTAESMGRQIGQNVPLLKQAVFKKTTKGRVSRGAILFKKLEKKSADPFGKLDLRVARVMKVEDHPNADRLYKLEVEVGKERRTLVAGLRQHVSKEGLQGRLVVIVANLKPHDFRGITSQGMMLAAEKEGKVEPIRPEGDAGAQVVAEGVQSRPAAEISIEDFSKIVLTTRNGVVVYGSRQLRTAAGVVTSVFLDNAKIR